MRRREPSTTSSAGPSRCCIPTIASGARREWRQAFREGREFEIEVRKRRYDGVYRWFLTRAVPHRDDGGKVVGWFGVTTDIHDQKELGEQLREADRRKDEFLATLAHELRNPLAAISSALDVLRHPERSEAQARWGQDVIERQATHLTRLVDDLVDVNRITRDKLELRKERVDLADVVARGGRGVPVAGGRGPGADASPCPPEPIHLRGGWDTARTGAPEPAHERGQVHEAATATSGSPRNATAATWCVRVADDGIGIAPEALPQLFDMFYQADRSLERTQGGLGIGLTLARRLVELHGGTIEAQQRRPGQRLRGRRAPARAARAVRHAGGSVAACRTTSAAQPRAAVLVADDNADAAQALGDAAQALAGHDVQTAADGAGGRGGRGTLQAGSGGGRPRRCRD